MREIQLTQGQVALVDDEDYNELVKNNWCLLARPGKVFYAKRRQKGPRKPHIVILMHRQIMDVVTGKQTYQVDHINHNGLDNRKCNLRICTHSENNRNQKKTRGSSQFKGVSWYKARHLWEAYIGYNGALIHLGRYAKEKQAALAYNAAAVRLFGAFSFTNIITEEDNGDNHANDSIGQSTVG